MSNIIELKIKDKIFSSQSFSILKDFSLIVEYGETVAIVGESGVGKTSLLNIIGLLDKKYQGTYRLFDVETNELSQKSLANWRNKEIGFVLQESSLINSLTLEDNIKLPFMYANVEKEPDSIKHFNRVVKKLGIESILKKKPLECSGGQRTRAAFARGIIMKPKLILADEPTASLDYENKENLMELLFDLNKENGSTVLTVTHDLSVATSHNRIIKIKGR